MLPNIDSVMSNPKMLNKDEISELIKLHHSGDDSAQEKLIIAYIPLIYSLTGEFMNSSTLRLSKEDLFQEGVIGFQKSLKSFDPDQGNLSMYAKPYIRRGIMDFILDNKSVIRTVTTKTLRKIYFNHKKYRDSVGNIDIKLMAENEGYPEDVIRDALERFSTTVTSSMVNNDGDETEVYNLIGCEWDGITDYENRQELDTKKERLKIAIAKLNPRQRDIIQRRYFMDEPESLIVLGEEYGVSFQRIQQIEKDALNIIKRHV